MKDDFDLPRSAKTAFEKYPDLQPSAAFNRDVLERIEQENKRRKTTLIGQIEEFLGLSLWRFAVSGLLGAFIPALILGALYCSNRSSQTTTPELNNSFNYPGTQEIDTYFALELEQKPEQRFSPQITPDSKNQSKSATGGEIS